MAPLLHELFHPCRYAAPPAGSTPELGLFWREATLRAEGGDAHRAAWRIGAPRRAPPTPPRHLTGALPRCAGAPLGEPQHAPLCEALEPHAHLLAFGVPP